MNFKELVESEFYESATIPNPEHHVFRLDPTPIKSFHARHFEHNDDWTESNHVPDNTPTKPGLKRTQGLFAGELHRVAPYAAMYHRGMTFLRHDDEHGNNVVVFHKKDKAAITNHTAHLSAFPRHDFHEAGDSGEHFKQTTHETKPLSQQKVKPLKLLKDTGHTIKFVDSIEHYKSTLPKDSYEGENL